MMTGSAQSFYSRDSLDCWPACFLLIDPQRQNQVEVSVKCLVELELAKESKLEQVLWALSLLSADMV